MFTDADLPCVILAIDPGADSGWCVVSGPKGPNPFVSTIDACFGGLARSKIERADAIAQAKRHAEGRGLKLVVIGETWRMSAKSGDSERSKKRWNTRTVAGLGASWGKWESELEGEVPKSCILRVDTGTWGRKVLGLPLRATSEMRKRRALLRFASVMNRNTDEDIAALDHNVAEAFCIALFGRRWTRVEKALGKRYLKGFD